MKMTSNVLIQVEVDSSLQIIMGEIWIVLVLFEELSNPGSRSGQIIKRLKRFITNMIRNVLIKVNHSSQIEVDQALH